MSKVLKTFVWTPWYMAITIIPVAVFFSEYGFWGSLVSLPASFGLFALDWRILKNHHKWFPEVFIVATVVNWAACVTFGERVFGITATIVMAVVLAEGAYLDYIRKLPRQVDS